MRIAVIGIGYVGLVTATMIANSGHHVTCVDIDEVKIENLKKNISPIFEKDLEQLISKNQNNGSLKFTTDISSAIYESEVIFISVGTPVSEEGKADLQYITTVAKEIGSHLNSYKIIVIKSTVPIGTNRKIKNSIKRILTERKVYIEFDIISNPEFLREGTAVQDFSFPDRLIIGYESKKALSIIKEMYDEVYHGQVDVIETSFETAEMIKFASNSFLATKIAFINEIGALCEAVGANIKDVSFAMGKDYRISPEFLQVGPGYGGSCFPKDTATLLDIGKNNNISMCILEATIDSNNNQKHRMVDKIISNMGSVSEKIIAILGTTFKAGTDDIRSSPALVVLEELMRYGAQLQVYDPAGMKNTFNIFKGSKERITFCRDEYAAIKDSDAIVVLTEWEQFKSLKIDLIKEITKGRMFFDLRNIYEREYLEKNGFSYFGIGVK